MVFESGKLLLRGRPLVMDFWEWAWDEVVGWVVVAKYRLGGIIMESGIIEKFI